MTANHIMTRQHSKLLSYWLRHAPDAGNLTLDNEGWADIERVRASLQREGLDPEILEETVASSDKQRFEFSDDGNRIRARQGHSVKVDLGWDERCPPDYLFHGTVERFLSAIFAQGLLPMARHHVHLSPDIETASRVGARRGEPVILRVAAWRMSKEGATFKMSSNGVWLVDAVPREFIERV